MKAANLANSSTANKRRELDFYPTPEDVSLALMRFLKLPACTIWEPACGNGAMSKVLELFGHTVISTDLRHTGYGEGGIDFLSAERKCDAVITNPPFNISEAFIKHALRQADIVAMLLKCQYWHAKKRAVLFAESPPAYVLPLTWRPDFMGGERGGAPTMDVAWSVWVPGCTNTKYRPLARDV